MRDRHLKFHEDRDNLTNPIGNTDAASSQHFVQVTPRYVMCGRDLVGAQVWVAEVVAGVFEDAQLQGSRCRAGGSVGVEVIADYRPD